MSKTASWEKIKGLLKERLPEPIYKVWFSSLQGEIKEEVLYLLLPNEFTRDWIKENYFSLLNKLARESGIREVKLVVAEEREAHQLIIPYNPTTFLGRKLSPKFTFEDFVTGKCNQFAYNVCYQIAEELPRSYMVYLCGHFGLGKTHLTQAVGNGLLKKGFTRVFYLTARDFLSYMLKYLKSGMIESFKDKFRKECDVLLLEGVDFFAGKDYTQTELAFLLDYLLEQGKTVVFTSIKLPQEISDLDSSLKSRLSSGLLIRLNPPDFSTRKKIIRHKAKKMGKNFPYEVVEYLARHIRGDVRQIESAVLGLIARSSLLKEPISLSLAKEVIAEIGADKKGEQDIEYIIETTCRFFGVSREKLFSASRKKEVSESRQVAMYLIRRLAGKSFKEIGELFGREHSTVIYNIKALEKKLMRDPSIKIKVDYICKEVEEELSTQEKRGVKEGEELSLSAGTA